MTDDTLFSAHPVTFQRILDLYGERAQVTGVCAWYSILRGWQPFPATSAMAMPVEQQIIALAKQGATHLQLYVDVAPDCTVTPDFLIHELYTPQCSTSRPASKSTEPAGAPASPPPQTNEVLPTT